jgi:hypothetical protein
MAHDGRVLSALEQLSAGGQDTAGLELHLGGLMAAKEGDFPAATAAFVAAKEGETSKGYVRAALHTSHQLALTVNFGGDLEKLGRYYRETFRTVKRLRNREGMALCLRTIGELALLKQDWAEMEQAWQLAARLFTALELPEAGQIAAWRGCAQRFARSTEGPA